MRNTVSPWNYLKNCALLRCYIVRVFSEKKNSFLQCSISFRRVSCSFTVSRFSKGVSEFKNRISKGDDNMKPKEMLTAQHRSIEMGRRQEPPNLVAKLMGLETLPLQESGPSLLRNHSRGDPQKFSDVPTSYWEEKGGFQYLDPDEHKVVYEIFQRSQNSPHAARYEETMDDRKMGLVRQKFIEAKRLSVNGICRQSKQFQDALEVLYSNKDLFLTCLQESHSMYSENLCSRQPDAHPAEKKRITILRPSKKPESNDFVEAGNKEAKKMKNGAFYRQNGLEKFQQGSSSPESSKYYKNISSPTQIVVLRPTRKKECHDIAMPYPRTEQSVMLHKEDFFRHIEDEEDQESRELAKEFAQQMHEKFGQPCKVENLISSQSLNGRVGGVSSFDNLEEHVDCHLYDSELVSPVYSHSRDYVDRLSPYSISPFPLPSYTPESSVCREAKKRLSERWVMMAPNEVGEVHRKYRKSSSTLGEMLALPELNLVSSHGEEGTSQQESEDSNFLLCNEGKGEEKIHCSPRSLIRSKSVPVSGGFGTRMTIGSPVPEKGKSESVKENTPGTSGKSSLREKVSSFFFSRAKTPDKETSQVSLNEGEFYQYPINTDRSGSLTDKESIHPSFLLEQSKASSSNPICMKVMSPENELVMEKPIASGNPGENLNQPSPISVLGPPFEEDEYVQKASNALPEQQGVEPPLLSEGSHLIDKSPPIESISRGPSWKDSDSAHPPKRYITKERDEEQECINSVEALLSEALLHGEAYPTSSLVRWHSLESPLDPSLRGKSTIFKDEKKLHDSDIRQKRAFQNLMYDCVNSALVNARNEPHGVDACIRSNNSTSSTILDEVWSNIKVWLSSEVRGMVDDSGENDSLVVEKVIRKEVEGKEWSHHFTWEIDNLGKEIQERLLEELTQEMVVEFKAFHLFNYS